MKRLGCVVLLLACGGDGGWQGSVEVLPNGAVRVTNVSAGSWGEDGGWRLVPEQRLGELDGADALVFAAIAGLEADDAGRIYVLDRQANELRIFEADGAHVRTAGRSGAGPGEYANANGLFWLTPDTLVVVDQRGNRYSIVDREGRHVRSVPRDLPFFAWAFTGGHEGGVVLEQVALGVERDQPALVGIPLRSEAGFGEDIVAAERPHDLPPASRRDTILLVPEQQTRDFFEVRTERGGMVMGVPFSAGPIRHLDGRGSIWSGHGSEFRIVRTTLAGDTLLEVLLEAEAAPVTDAELDEWRSGEGVARFVEMGGDLDMSRVPRRKPYFDDLYIDPDGNIWASVPAAPLETHFALFDPDGRYLGRLGAAGFERLSWVRPVVRNDRLYLAGRDMLDVQRVYVYRIER
jgi:hypothetical protein